MADSSAPAGTAARLAELARRVAVSLDLQATLQLVADAVVENLSFRAVAVNIERPGGMYEVVAVAGPDDVKGLLGQVAPGSAYREILDASEAWGDLRFYSHLNEYPDDMPSWVSPALESAEGPGAWHPQDTLLAPLHAQVLRGSRPGGRPAAGTGPVRAARAVRGPCCAGDRACPGAHDARELRAAVPGHVRPFADRGRAAVR
jgi:hypothetical protein